MIKWYLASTSPRRKELLSLLRIPFETLTIDVDERRNFNEDLSDYVLRLSKDKALAGINVRSKDLPVLGADTIVTLNGEALGKPSTVDDAREMLARLSGKIHTVLTAITLTTPKYSLSELVSTEVEFKVLTDDEIEQYLLTKEPFDKAGAYGIQGYGGVFVRRIVGSYHAVVGLPLLETKALFDHIQQLHKQEE